MEIQYAKLLVPKKEILDYVKGLGFELRVISAPIKQEQWRLLYEGKRDNFTVHIGFPLEHVMFFIMFFPEGENKAVFRDRFFNLLNHFVAMAMIYCYAPEEIPPKVLEGLKSMGEIYDSLTGEKL